MTLAEKKLFEKYSKVRIPFYNLYPTQSNWNDANNLNTYQENLKNLFNEDVIPSLYLHFPFCPKQCYFCHCYTVISKKDDHYRNITQVIIQELKNLFELILKLSNREKIQISDIHFGGGTPSVIPMDLFESIMNIFKKYVDNNSLKEVAIEVDPRNGMTEKQLLEYHSLGVKRISLGIQDFDQNVQKAVNRVNTYEMIDNLLTKKVRDVFSSINFDYIYGLPKQTINSVKETRKKIVDLNPDRIHFLSMEHRPDVYKHQKAYNEKDLPSMMDKVKMYDESAKFFENSGYTRIGLHKFAKEGDILTKYKKEEKLYRNPNGYSPGWSYNMLAVGPSATGKLGNYYFQNLYSLENYEKAVRSNQIPIIREKNMDKNDRIRHRVIMDLMSYESIDLNKFYNLNKISFAEYFKSELNRLKLIENEGFLIFNKQENKYRVTKTGEHFINNICHIFDGYQEYQYASHREFKDGAESFDRAAALKKNI